MWGVDLTHTSHTGAQTGIQQVCRDLMAGLAGDGFAKPLVHDRFSRHWREPDRRESILLDDPERFGPTRRRSSSWTLRQRLRGRFMSLFRPSPTRALSGLEGLFAPEIFDPLRDQALLTCPIPRAALFYDAIPLLHPEWTPAGTVRRFPAYLRTLARLDLVCCISRSSERDLLHYWDEQKLQASARTVAVPLGLPRSRVPRSPVGDPRATSGRVPVILMIGTLEARKNHLALLEAAESLWARGLRFELKLVGMLNRETGAPVRERIGKLQQRQRPLTWPGALPEAALMQALREADLFVYPSRYEGFGLPVLEALAHGIPCITSDNSALRELTGNGGVLTCGVGAESIAGALEALLRFPQKREALRQEALARPVRTMADACADLRGHLSTLLQA